MPCVWGLPPEGPPAEVLSPEGPLPQVRSPEGPLPHVRSPEAGPRRATHPGAGSRRGEAFGSRAPGAPWERSHVLAMKPAATSGVKGEDAVTSPRAEFARQGPHRPAAGAEVPPTPPN